MAKISSAPAAVQALTRQARLYLQQQGIKASSTFVNYNSKKRAMRIKLYGTAADTTFLLCLGFAVQVVRGCKSATVYINENGVIMPTAAPAPRTLAQRLCLCPYCGK